MESGTTEKGRGNKTPRNKKTTIYTEFQGSTREGKSTNTKNRPGRPLQEGKEEGKKSSINDQQRLVGGRRKLHNNLNLGKKKESLKKAHPRFGRVQSPPSAPHQITRLEKNG